MDYYGNPLKVEASINGNTLTCTLIDAGPDGIFGTADDIIFTVKVLVNPPSDSKDAAISPPVPPNSTERIREPISVLEIHLPDPKSSHTKQDQEGKR